MNKIELFENRQIRSIWNEETSEWYFSVVDVIGVLTEQSSARSASTYWAVLKKRLAKEAANELLTNCKQLKLPAADGKNYLTDVAETKHIFRLIQSIPSPKSAISSLNAKALPGRTTKTPAEITDNNGKDE